MRIRQSHVNPLLVLAVCGLVPTPVAAQAFGGAVLVADGRVYVGQAAHEREPGTVRVYADDGEWVEIATLMAPEAQVRDGFGSALARAGELLLVGARGVDGGRIYVYRLDDIGSGNPVPVQTLSDPDLEGMGDALTAFGDELAVVARNPGGTRLLAMFRPGEGGEWSRAGTIDIPQQAGVTGTSWLAMSGELAVVANPADSEVHVFARDDGSWIPAGVLAAPESPEMGAPVPFFGVSVAVFEQEVLIGEMMGQTVHRYARVDGDWSRIGTIEPTDETLGFGWSLALDGSTLIVGDPRQVFAYQRSGGDWIPAGSANIHDEGSHEAASSQMTLDVADGIVVFGEPSADFGLGAATVFSGNAGQWTRSAVFKLDYAPLPAINGGEIACADGGAAGYDCDHVDLLSFVPWAELGAGRGARLNDVWGWTDPLDGREYALVGRMDGTAFVDVTDPYNPRYLGNLAKTEGSRANSWRDMKVYRDHAFVVADGAGQHGMQIFDLTELRDVTEPREFEATAMYTGIASSHNIAINEETGFAYLVGSSDGGETCGGGSHMVDINDPLNPVFAGCFAHPNTGRRNTGNSHDTQCVIYHGPDEDYAGREICVNSNETALSIADVTDKDNPIAVAAADYPNVAYAHQGWLTEDHRYFYSNDELDEVGGLVDATRTLIWDLEDLDDPLLLSEYMNPTRATDHNMYVKGDRLYMSNNRAGLRVLDISDPENPTELGYFDTTPWSADEAGFDGTWSVYPYFESGSVLLSSRREGLFIVRPRARRLIP